LISAARAARYVLRARATLCALVVHLFIPLSGFSRRPRADHAVTPALFQNHTLASPREAQFAETRAAVMRACRLKAALCADTMRRWCKYTRVFFCCRRYMTD